MTMYRIIGEPSTSSAPVRLLTMAPMKQITKHKIKREKYNEIPVKVFRVLQTDWAVMTPEINNTQYTHVPSVRVVVYYILVQKVS